MQFPNLVYRSPGTHQGVGGTFDYLPVADVKELKAAADDGWYPSPELAINPPEKFSWKEYLVGLESVDETTPPTREELEAKATELKIKFTDKMKDETLLTKIDDALAAQES